MSIGSCACDTREPHPVSECIVPGESSEETMRRDVADLCTTLGLGAHARPYSAHAVIHREVLPAIRVLHSLATEMINDPEASAADYGYDLAHRLGMLEPEGDGSSS